MNTTPESQIRFCEDCGEMFDSSDPYVAAFHETPAHVGIVRLNRARKASFPPRFRGPPPADR